MIRAALLSFVTTILVAAPAFAKVAPPDGAAGLKVGVAAPQFILPVVNAFEGGKKWGPAKWSAEQGEQSKKLVILSFFATYCEPCKKEMPELARLYDKYQHQGLGIMLVSIDKGAEQRQEIIDLAEQHGVRFPVLHDRFQVVARRYAAERLPYMLMLDPSGAVRRVHVGYTEELKANLENEVRTELGLPPLVAEEIAEEEPAGAASPVEKKSKAKGKTKRKLQKTKTAKAG